MHYLLRDHEGEPNLLRLLKDAGYYIWWGGKNDLVPSQSGYSQHCSNKLSVSESDYAHWGHTPRKSLHGWTDWRGEPGSDTYYSFYVGRLDTGPDDIYCDGDWAAVLSAVDFIGSYNGEQPLCIYLPLFYPHPPYGVEEPWFSQIDRSKLPPRVAAPEDWEGKPITLAKLEERFNIQGWSEERWNELRAVYYGMCARVDHQFGLVLDALKQAGLYDDTAVFFLSDHGDFTGDYGLVEKTQNTFEDCLTRVPLVVKLPGHLSAGVGVVDALVELVDFPATVFDLLRIDPGYWHFGRSLLPLVTGDTHEHRDAVFSEGGRLRDEAHCAELQATRNQKPTGLYWPRLSLQAIDDPPYHGKAAMCRTRDFKYVMRLYERDELYDLRKDPQELRNVVGVPEYAAALSGLKARLLAWYMETCDVVPLKGDLRESRKGGEWFSSWQPHWS
jgi:arylsulfatase A-like enzyme